MVTLWLLRQHAKTRTTLRRVVELTVRPVVGDYMRVFESGGKFRILRVERVILYIRFGSWVPGMKPPDLAVETATETAGEGEEWVREGAEDGWQQIPTKEAP